MDLGVLGRMTDTLQHRGPDDRGLETWGNIGFGHRRLSIIDIESGHQPMSNAAGSIWVTFNGEVYNHVELRSDLIQRGYSLKTYCDTEVLLCLYECYGLDMFRHIRGMFAFAIYDLNNERILLARDRFGEKPLYYYRDEGQFVFASEVKAILQVPGVVPELNDDALPEYLTFQYCLNSKTLFKDIHRIRPASYLLVDLRGQMIEGGEYWRLGFEEDHTKPEERYLDELRFVVEDAVKIQLRSDVPVGTYLSGGVDSSAVAGVAAMSVGYGLPAFTGFFDEGSAYSELQYAEAAATEYGSELHTVCPSPRDLADNLGSIIYHMDEPAAGPGVFPQFMVSRLASEHVKVALGGQGGDEIFGGYARYFIMYLEASIQGLIFDTQDERKHVVTLGQALPNLVMLQQYVPMLQKFWSQGMFEPIERRYFSLVSRIGNVSHYLSGDMMESWNQGQVYSAFESEFNDILRKVPNGKTSLFNRMTSYDVRTMLQSLLHVEDRMSMASSLESRMPFLDHRIVELAFRTPPLYKFRNGKPKAMLLSAMKSILPTAVSERQDKMGFPVPFEAWAKGPLRDFVSDVLLGSAARARGLYQEKGIRELLTGDGKFGRELWGLLCLELWFQTFIDGTLTEEHQ